MNSHAFDSQSLMANLLTHVEDAIYFKDRESRFRLVNAAVVRSLRQPSAEAVIGRTDFDFFGGEHPQAAYAIEQEIIRTGQPVLYLEEQEVFRDGSVQWCSTCKYPLRDETGEVIGIFGINRDITARKQAEAEVAKLRRELLDRERRLAVVDFAELILFHTNQMANVSGLAIDRISSVMTTGHFAQIKQLAERLLALLPADTPALDPCISLLGEVELEAEQQEKTHQDLLSLKHQLQAIIELLNARKKDPAAAPTR
jgi:PAS domain S-box-containing protein